MYFSYWGGKLTGMNDIHIPAFTIRKEIVVGIIFFVAGAFLFAAFSTIATTIGTNVSVTGHLFATSTVQATGNIVGYADLIMGTTTPWKGRSEEHTSELQSRLHLLFPLLLLKHGRSEERRVGKEGRSRWSPYH